MAEQRQWRGGYEPSTRPSSNRIGVLAVCLGNICRSPTAEAVLKMVLKRHGLAERVFVDSCGTGGGSPDWYKRGGWSFHEGNPADERMAMAARARDVHLTSRSRPLRPADLETFDVVLAMDESNVSEIRRAARYWGEAYAALAERKVHRVTDYCRTYAGAKSVPDPYYGGADGFERVLDLLEDACEGLVTDLLAKK